MTAADFDRWELQFREGDPPSPEWHAIRGMLGIPSHAGVFGRSCPWCEAGVGEPCYVRAIGRRAKHPHDARINPAQAEEVTT
jgi:hypothetical protein